MSSPHTTTSSSNTRKYSESHSETRQLKSSRNKYQVQTSTGMNFGGGGSSSGHSRKRKLDSSPPDSPASASPDEDSSGGDGTSCTSLQLTPSKVSRHESVGGSSVTGLASGLDHELQSTSAGGSLFFYHGLGDQQPPHLFATGYTLGSYSSKTMGCYFATVHALGGEVAVAVAGDPVAHRYVVHISDTGLLAQRARSATDFSADGRVMPPTGSANAPTDAAASSSSNNSGGGSRGCCVPGRRSSHQYRFDCELGDVWTDVTGVDRISGLMTSLLDGVIAPRKPYRMATTSVQPSTDAAVMDALEIRGYSVLSQLSRGQFNTLILLAHSSAHQKKVVIKVLPSRDVRCTMTRDDVNTDKWKVEIPNEVLIHESLTHENIVTLISHHVVDNRHALSLELCENGSVRKLLAKTAGGLLTEPVCRRYFRQMLSAVTHLHSRSIVHRDVRADNFLLDSYDHIKLADFGLAMRYANGERLFTSRQGFPGYWLPEVLERKEFNPRNADVWGLGVTLFVMLTSRLPFGSEPESDSLVCMQRGLQMGGNTGPATSVRLSTSVVELLRGMLHYVAEVRYSLNRIRSSDWMNASQVVTFKAKPVGSSSGSVSSTSGTATSCSTTTGRKPYIGNFYLVAQPQKFKDSPHEKLLKDTFDI